MQGTEAASGARGSWLRCGREQTTATAASDGQPVHLEAGAWQRSQRRAPVATSRFVRGATDPRRYAARVPRYI